MTIAFSLPDRLFEELDACAKHLKLTRSALLATAARQFLDQHAPPNDATDAWNKAISQGGQPAADPAAKAFSRSGKTTIRKLNP